MRPNIPVQCALLIDTLQDLIHMRIPTDREPTHPGEMLRAEFLEPMGISQRELAEAIHVPYQRVNELVNQKRGVTPSTALRLAKFFNVSADYWLNLQSHWDLYWAQQSEKDDIESIADFSQVKNWSDKVTRMR